MTPLNFPNARSMVGTVASHGNIPCESSSHLIRFESKTYPLGAESHGVLPLL